MVGSTLYTYDTNRRVRRADGTSDPAHYWRGHIVIGENKQSWLLEDNYKVDKKTLELRGIKNFYGLHKQAYTEAQKADKVWKDANQSRIVDAVKRADAATLRRVEALLEETRV